MFGEKMFWRKCYYRVIRTSDESNLIILAKLQEFNLLTPFRKGWGQKGPLPVFPL